MPPAEFEPTIAAGERPKTYALDRAATGIDIILTDNIQKQIYMVCQIFIKVSKEETQTMVAVLSS
jgi:hypothetical protein